MLRLLPSSIIFTLTSLILLCGSANGQFETRVSYPTFQSPTSIGVGDFNGDGNLDIAVAAKLVNTEVSIFLGKGDGTFQSPVNYAAGNGPASIAVADFNHDGKLDLAVADAVSATVNVLLGNGDGTFQTSSYSLPEYASLVFVGDFNGDTVPDLAVLDATQDCSCVSILLGNGDGTFQAAKNVPVNYNETMAIGDFNGDSKLDLVVAAAAGVTSKMQIMLGNGDGTFNAGPSYLVGSDPISISVADLNGDKKLDIAVASDVAPEVNVFLGNGDGTFQSPSVYYAKDPAFVMLADLSGDGVPDLLVADRFNQPGLTIFPGNGDGTFGISSYYPAGRESAYAAIGDFNGDGKPDLAVADFLANKVIMLLNTGVATFSPVTPITFVTQLIGTTSASQAVTLTNSGMKTMAISSMAAKGPFAMASTCGPSLAVGASCSISATFSPKAAGTASGTISISDSASSKPQVIELAGTGTVVKLSPSSLSFGSEKVGSKSAPQKVRMTNVGNSGLNITKIQLAGNNPGDFSETTGCSSTLAAHATCSFTLTFAPTKTGARVAALQITDSGGGSPQTVKLSGTGD
ncbi:MAG: FG-GAP-like repeat-containing protein [Candidatus Sulfotelmatobacter sp.]